MARAIDLHARVLAAGRALVYAALGVPAVASANPRPLPMSQPYETLVEDRLEIEQRVDAVPVLLAPVTTGGAPGTVWSLRSELSTELRLGWSDRLELGVSLGARQDAGLGTPSLRLAGFGQRARLRLAEAGDWPIDVALQVALAEHHDGIGAAERVIVSWRHDALLVLANFEVEQRYGSPGREWTHAYQPTAGVAYEVTPRVSAGVEYRARGRLDPARAGPPGADDPDDPGDRDLHYAGPAVLVQRGRLWLAAGVHARLDRIAKGAPVDDRFGKLWVRALLGLEL
jgi:hypothetical protein